MIEDNTNMEECFNSLKFDKHLAMLGHIYENFPTKQDFFIPFILRLRRFYKILSFLALWLTTEFFYDDPKSLKKSGVYLGTCQKMAFEIVRNMQKDIINLMCDNYDVGKSVLKKKEN